MDSNLTEFERAEMVKAWIKKNGPMLVLGVILGVVIVYFWKSSQEQAIIRGQQAAAQYEQMLMVMNKRRPNMLTGVKPDDKSEKQAEEELIKIGKSIFRDHASAIYANDAAMALAKIYVDKNDYEAAQRYLQDVLGQQKKGSVNYHIASIRLARVLRDQGKYDDAMLKLTVSDAGQFQKYYEYIRGTVHEEKKQCGPARDAYQKSLVLIDAENKQLVERSVDKQIQVPVDLRRIIEQRMELVRNC